MQIFLKPFPCRKTQPLKDCLFTEKRWRRRSFGTVSALAAACQMSRLEATDSGRGLSRKAFRKRSSASHFFKETVLEKGNPQNPKAFYNVSP